MSNTTNPEKKTPDNGRVIEGQAIVPASQKPAVTSIVPQTTGYLPSFPTRAQIDEYKEFLQNYNEFIDSQLSENIDFGKVPGVEKPSLLKPGAEKLEKLFFLTHEKTQVEKIVDPGFVKYTYRTTIFDKNGNIKATCEGTCNSKETKYRYTNVNAKDANDEQKRNGQQIKRNGQYGEYVVYRVEKKDFYDVENTIMKMAQKRSYVGAILEATNSSGRFTQDVEDMPNEKQFNNGSENSKYTKKNTNPTTSAQNNYRRPAAPVTELKCEKCQKAITKGVADYSFKNFKYKLCQDCQKKAKDYYQGQNNKPVAPVTEQGEEMMAADWQLKKIRDLALQKIGNDYDGEIDLFLEMFGLKIPNGRLENLTYKTAHTAIGILQGYNASK